jgi:paraquat-inducible protein B
MSRANPTLVGAFVVGGIALAVAAAVALGAQRASSNTKPFVVHVVGTANGLRVGAPVKFKGVQVGAVDRIAIHVRASTSDLADLPIAVFCSIDEERLIASRVGAKSARSPGIPELVSYGLRARLETESLVTGIRYIAATFEAEDSGTRHGDLDGVPEVPWLPSSSEVLEMGVEEVIAKLNRVDLVGLVDEAKITVKSLGEIGRSAEFRSSMTNLDQTLASTRRMVEQLERDLVPGIERLEKTFDATGTLATEVGAGVAEAREALASLRKLVERVDAELGPFASSISTAASDVGTAARDFSGTIGKLDGTTDPNAPLLVHLQASLVELASAARAARALLEHLERDPSQLLRGRALPEGEER